MAHIQITYGSTGDGPPAKVVVDGVDITKAVLSEGFGVEFIHGRHRAEVSMRLRADRLDLDLPDATLEALTVSERVKKLAAEHANCSGCPTPWWLTAALNTSKED